MVSNMKKITFLILLFLLFTTPARSQAHFSEIEVVENTITFSLSEIGYTNHVLLSPVDVDRVLFNTPSNWNLSQGATLTLNFDTLVNGRNDANATTGEGTYAGTLSILFNDEFVKDININLSGSFTEELSIPASAMQTARSDGRHELEFLFISKVACTYNIQSVVTIKASSILSLPFEETEPILNLASLPYPFYTRNSIVAEQVLVVIPENADANILEAAYNVAAGFGSMSNGDMLLELVTETELTQDILDVSHLVFVGMPNQFERLSEIVLPVPVVDRSFSSLASQNENDGIIQVGFSPWGTGKVVLLISGTTEEAVGLASQAISTGNLFAPLTPDLVFIKNIQQVQGNLATLEHFTLHDLGYEHKTLMASYVDNNQETAVYSFYLTQEQAFTQEGYVDVVYNHSALLLDESASVNVLLNGKQLGSLAINDETINLNTQHLIIPSDILRFGENFLEFDANLPIPKSCSAITLNDIWAQVLSETTIHIPKGEVVEATLPNLLDFKVFPGIFTENNTLENLAFVIPEAEPAAWKTAFQLAFTFGDVAHAPISALSVSFGNNVPDEVLNNRSLIMVGKASSMPIMSVFMDFLPAPIDLNENTPSEHGFEVIYRVPEGVPLGFLELLRSPFAANKVVLVVAGNSDEGVQQASNALLTGEIRRQLLGVFALTSNSQVLNGQIRDQMSKQPSPIVVEPDPEVPAQVDAPETPIEVTTPSPELDPLPTEAGSTFERPSWLFPLFIGSGVLLLAIVVILAWGKITSKSAASS